MMLGLMPKLFKQYYTVAEVGCGTRKKDQNAIFQNSCLKPRDPELSF